MRLNIVVGFVLLIIIIGLGIIYDLHNSDTHKPQPVSKLQTETISSGINTFHTQYFKFQDTGKWAQDVPDSTANKFIFFKYNGLDVQYELSVYVNQTPIPLYLASSRVLPVRLVNNNSFDVTDVSDLCAKSYAPAQLGKEEIVNINGANMLCDPDTPQYTVELALIGGNYQLNLQRKDGTPIQFVITFRDLTMDPGPDTLIQVANTFHAL